MKKLRIGVLGGGAIARASHIPGYAANENCELTAIADILPSSLAGVREKWHFEHEYSDCSELLQKERPDLVSICLPNKYHARYAIEAMECGCDVILEKPVAVSMEEAEAIKAAQQRTGRRLAVCFSHRFNPLAIAARDAVLAGKIGEPYMIHVRFAHTGPYPGWAKTDWFYNPEMAGGGAVLDMGIHAIDLAHWFIGDIKAVTGFSETLRKKIEVEDNTVAAFKFDRPAMGYIECGWTSVAGFYGLEIMGDKGAVLANYAEEKTILTQGGFTPDGKFETRSEVIGTLTVDAWENQMAKLIEAELKEEPFPTSIDDGIKALKVALAIYDSAKTGRTIEL